MEGHKGRKETRAKKGKRNGRSRGGLCGIHQGGGERNRTEEGTKEAEGGEEGKEGGEGGLSEGITGLPLNAKGPAGAQRGPTEQAAQRATAGVGAP